MSGMQFRDYVFKHNPERIKISEGSRLFESFCPGKGAHVSNLGKKAAEIRCQGCFTGETSTEASGQAAEFRRRVSDSKSGMLYLPGMEPFMAEVKEFVMDLRGDGRALAYTIVFTGAEGGR